MAGKTTKVSKEAFAFLSPLDGKTYTLPPFDPAKEVAVDVLREQQKDDLLPTVRGSEFFRMTIAERKQRAFELWFEEHGLRQQSRVTTFIAHGLADESMAAVEALIVAGEWDALFKIYDDWAAGEQAVSESGEASTSPA